VAKIFFGKKATHEMSSIVYAVEDISCVAFFPKNILATRGENGKFKKVLCYINLAS
jgi:hypothetical protein